MAEFVSSHGHMILMLGGLLLTIMVVASAIRYNGAKIRILIHDDSPGGENPGAFFRMSDRPESGTGDCEDGSDKL